MIKPLFHFYRSPGGGDGGGVEFTPEQETVIATRVSEALENHKPEIDISSATAFMKNAGIQTFKSQGDYHNDIVSTLTRISSERIENPNSLEKSVIKFKSSLAGEVLSPVDQEFKVLTGKEKLENEKTRDYIKRVLPEVMKGSNVDLAEFNSLKSNASKATQTAQEWEQKFNTLETQIVENEKTALISKGIPTNLDYSVQEMQMMIPGINSRINDRFEMGKDEKGFYMIDKNTEEVVLTNEGHRKPIDVVVSEFVNSLTDLRFKNEDGSPRKGATLPNGKDTLTGDALVTKEAEWRKALTDKGLIGHEKESAVLRKNLGLPISEAVLKRWPDLK